MDKPMSPRVSRTTAGLAGAITVAVAAAFAAGAYLYSDHHFESLLDTARENAVAQGELIREALEHQMMEKDRRLIGEMVRGFGNRTEVESLDVLDHLGRIWYSTDGTREGTSLSIDSPACLACHQDPPPVRGTSQVIQGDDQALLRVVVPIRNHEGCHQCHNPAVSVNGIVILDSDVGGIRASLNRDLRWLVGGGALLAFVLVGVVVGLVQLLLLRRLRRFENAARSIAGGDLEQRVPEDGSDTISWLGREFNTMADSVTGLLREVGQQRERLETVINSIEDGIVVLDPGRRIVAANKSFLERTGFGREEVLGCSCADSVGGICNTGDCPTVACFGTGEHQVRLCQRIDPGGEVAWEEVHSSPVRDPGGKIIQVVEVWRDISDRRGAEARLAESHRLASLGMLASGFSHEINTPLATVLTCVESILRQIREGEGPEPGLERIGDTAAVAREQVLRCKGITQHFLRLSRGHSSPGELVDVGESLEAVLRLVEPTADARGVDVECEATYPELLVRANEADLQHALINVLMNAVEACDRQGKVTVEVEGGDPIRVRVADDGEGVPPDQMERIFEPFVSLREGGTGLGLFLAMNFVRQWGGDIQVHSEPGQGSVFEIVLPAVARTPSAEALA